MLLLSLMFVGLLIGYLLGSIPTGYLMGRLVAGIDIREHGSGSTGATNILRTLGKGPALFVLVFDALKGGVALLMAQGLAVHWVDLFTRWSLPMPANAALQLEASLSWVLMLTGLGAVIGHSRSIWLKFTGGKSVATSLGILLTLSWPVAFIAFGIWLISLGLSRIVSLSSIVAALSISVLMVAFHQPPAYSLFGFAGGLYVVATHRHNIERLVAGTEPRVGQKSKSSPESEPTTSESTA